MIKVNISHEVVNQISIAMAGVAFGRRLLVLEAPQDAHTGAQTGTVVLRVGP